MVVILVGAVVVPGIAVGLVVVEKSVVPLVESPIWKLASL